MGRNEDDHVSSGCFGLRKRSKKRKQFINNYSKMIGQRLDDATSKWKQMFEETRRDCGEIKVQVDKFRHDIEPKIELISTAAKTVTKEDEGINVGINVLKEKIRESEDRFLEVTQDLNALKSHCRDYENEIERLGCLNERLESELVDKSNKLYDITTETDDLKTEIATHKQENKILNDRLLRTRDKLAKERSRRQVEQDCEICPSQNEALSNACACVHATLQNHVDENVSLRFRNGDLSKKVTSMQGRVDSLEAEKRNMQKHIKLLQSRYEDKYKSCLEVICQLKNNSNTDVSCNSHTLKDIFKETAPSWASTKVSLTKRLETHKEMENKLGGTDRFAPGDNVTVMVMKMRLYRRDRLIDHLEEKVRLFEPDYDVMSDEMVAPYLDETFRSGELNEEIDVDIEASEDFSNTSDDISSIDDLSSDFTQ